MFWALCLESSTRSEPDWLHLARNTPLLLTTHHYLKPSVNSVADVVEISFLSMARTGTIIVREDELCRAIDALKAK